MNISSYNINRKLLIAILILFFGISSSNAQFRMGNTLTPLTGNLYPIILSNDAKGGFHQVATIADRNAIPALRRQEGMLCAVLNAGSGTSKTYQLIGGILDTNWVEFTLGGTGTAIVNDITTSTAVYPTWVTANTGNLQHYVSSEKLSFVPSTGIITTSGFVKSGGTASQFLKADGTIDENTYLTSSSNITIPINKLVQATANNTIDNLSFDQTWNWSTLTTGTGLSIAASKLTTGKGLSITSAGTDAATGQTGLNVSLSGANATTGQTTYGTQVSNTHTGAGTNVGLNVSASGGTNNYALLVSSGNVGIGTTAPAAKLDVSSPSLGESAGNRINGTVGSTASIGSNLRLTGTSLRTIGTGPSLTFAFPANTDGTNVWEQARILGAPANANNTDAAGRLYLQVRDQFDAGNGNDWNWRTGLMINNNGNVGIGTTTPGALLDVKGTMSMSSDNSFMVFDDGTSARLAIIKKGGLEPQIASASGSPIIFSQYGTTSFFGSAVSTTTLTERMRIASNGNVGIGTTTPGVLLDLGTPGTTAGVIRMGAGSGGSGSVTIQAASSAITSYTLTLPTAKGTINQVLATDGNGVLGWTTPAAPNTHTTSWIAPTKYFQATGGATTFPTAADFSTTTGITFHDFEAVKLRYALTDVKVGYAITATPKAEDFDDTMSIAKVVVPQEGFVDVIIVNNSSTASSVKRDLNMVFSYSSN